MKSMPLISVIIPIYKVEKYLDRCIQSVIGQTYSNLEIILVDDGSPDRCPKMCDEWAQKDSRICAFHKPNGGLSDARNFGAVRSKGEYITFIDSDDYVAQNYVEYLYNLLIQAGADISCCNLRYVYNSNIDFDDQPEEQVEVISGRDACYKMYDKLQLIVAVVKLYKRKLILETLFPVGRLHEDEAVNYKLLYACSKVAIGNQAFYAYYQHTGSITHRGSEKNVRDILLTGKERIVFFKERKEWGLYALAIRFYADYLTGRWERVPTDEKKKAFVAAARYGVDPRMGLKAKAAIFYNILKKIAKKLIKIIYNEISWIKTKIKIENIHKKRKQAVIFIATPIHGNLGDQAIVYSQYKFFESLGLEKRIIEIHRYQYEMWREKLENVIKRTDLIIIDGGGNIGTLWLEEEKKMRDIVTRFDKNQVFVFPQTVSYSNDEEGRYELECSRKAYSANKKLFVFVRDKKSFEFMTHSMPEIQCMYTPDMVMFIQDAQTSQKRNGIGLCLRKDTERVLSVRQQRELKQKMQDDFGLVKEISTLVLENVRTNQRQRKLREKWNEFSGLKLVVTDRLHGMIFSAITGTPCIALDNVSQKVSGGYQWLSYLPYLRFCDSVEEVENAAKELLKLSSQMYEATPLMPFYNEMKEAIKDAMETVEQNANCD